MDSTVLIVLILFCCSISLSGSGGGALFFGDDISDYISKIIKPQQLGTTSGTSGTSATTSGNLAF
jgi:hypothetical protein